MVLEPPLSVSQQYWVRLLPQSLFWLSEFKVGANEVGVTTVELLGGVVDGISVVVEVVELSGETTLIFLLS